jgi:hypothetical protein
VNSTVRYAASHVASVTILSKVNTAARRIRPPTKTEQPGCHALQSY